MIASRIQRLCLTIILLSITACSQTVETTAKPAPIAKAERLIPGKYVAVLNVDPGKPLAGNLGAFCKYDLVFGKQLEGSMRAAIESLFEDVEFVAKSGEKISLPKYGAIGGISISLKRAKPAGRCVGSRCNADMDFTIRLQIIRPGYERIEKELTRGGFKSGDAYLSPCLTMTGLLRGAQALGIKHLQEELISEISKEKSLYR